MILILTWKIDLPLAEAGFLLGLGTFGGMGRFWLSSSTSESV